MKTRVLFFVVALLMIVPAVQAADQPVPPVHEDAIVSPSDVVPATALEPSPEPSVGVVSSGPCCDSAPAASCGATVDCAPACEPKCKKARCCKQKCCKPKRCKSQRCCKTSCRQRSKCC